MTKLKAILVRFMRPKTLTLIGQLIRNLMTSR